MRIAAVCIILTILIIIKNIHFTDSRVYEFIFEKGELLFANHSFVKNVYFHFGKVNRTFTALNSSFDIIQDFKQKLFGTVKCFQFFHNEYRFTGIHITADTCKIEKANIFSMKQQFEESQFNISLCNLKKGSYKIVNFSLQAKYFPTYLPEGKLRSHVRLHDGQGSDLFSLNWDFEIKRKSN